MKSGQERGKLIGLDLLLMKISFQKNQWIINGKRKQPPVKQLFNILEIIVVIQLIDILLR